MNPHPHARRSALRAAVSVTLLAGIVTSVVAAYQGYQALVPTGPREAAREGAPAARELAASSAAGAGPQAARPALAASPAVGRPAAPARGPESQWPAGPGPGWGLRPASLPASSPAAGWALAPASGVPAAAGGGGPPLGPWPWGRQPAMPQPALSPAPGPGRVGGKACGMGFGMGFG